MQIRGWEMQLEASLFATTSWRVANPNNCRVKVAEGNARHTDYSEFKQG